MTANLSFSCPMPHPPGQLVLLAHGEGARMTRRLIREILLEAFDNEFLRPLADGTVLPPIDGPIVMTTDSYVVSPLVFPGGDIGKLAVYGTINDLAVCGATPLYLSLALIVEEGLSLETLKRVVGSIRDAALACRTPVVTGDFKAVPRGAADGLFVNSTGIGRLRPGVALGPDRIQPGDRVLVSGTIGDHGMAIMAAREGFDFESTLRSDTAPLHELVQSLLASCINVRFLRDATRGGVAAVLHEVVESCGWSVILEESSLPVAAPVRGACELLGLDPLHVANEGKLVAIVASENAEEALACLRRNSLGRDAAIIGEVVSASTAQVLVRGLMDAVRVLDEPSGAPLPRIC